MIIYTHTSCIHIYIYIVVSLYYTSIILAPLLQDPGFEPQDVKHKARCLKQMEASDSAIATLEDTISKAPLGMGRNEGGGEESIGNP